MSGTHGISRREFCRLGLLAVASTALPSAVTATHLPLRSENRWLYFYNLHTKEDLCITYCRDGEYIPEALKDFNYILRDHYNGAVRHIDTKLLDLMFAIREKLGTREPFHIISGYRTPKTNAYLKKLGKVVSSRSLHMYGKAVDVRLPGTSLKTLRRAAYELKGGGVGYYPRSNFVHIDVGKVRYW